MNNLRLLTLTFLALATSAVTGLGQSSTWNTTTSGALWTLDTNWVGNVVADGSGNTANFGQLDIPADTTVNLNSDRTIGNLIFGDTGATGDSNWILAAGIAGSDLTLEGATPTITVNNPQATITAVVAGSSGFTKNGTGTLRLEGTNTISGPITLSAGFIQLIGKPLANATSVALNGGTLILGGNQANAIGGTISFGGGTWQFNQSPATDYSSQFSTAANQKYNFNTGAAVTFASDLSSAGGNLTKSGTANLTLSAANTFSGTTTVSEGNLILSNALALQNSVIDATNSVTGSASQGLVLSGVTTPTIGGLTGTKDLSTLFNSSTGNYSSVTNLTLNPGTGANYSYSGNITNGASGMILSKSGAGTQTLSGNNSYTGGTAINAGTLALGSANAVGTTGTISFGGGTLRAFNTTDYSSRFSTAASQAYNIDTNGQNITWATGLASSAGSLTKSGAGNLTLTGGLANTFNGTISINGGRLSVTDGTSLKNATGAITVASGASFRFSQNFGANNLTNALILNGAGDGTYGALHLEGNTVATGGINLVGNTTITHDYNNATIQSGAITGSGWNLQLTTTLAGQPGLVINSAIQTGTGGVSVTGAANTGTYSVQLGGNNTYSGATTISSGTLEISSTGRLGGGSYSGNISNSGTFIYSGTSAQTLSGVISGAGALTKTGSSTLTLSGNNTYSGATTISSGTLEISSAGGLGGGSYSGNISNSGTFIYSGTSAQTLSGVISGAGALTKTGSSTLTLSGNNTYSGATTISAGTLQIGNGLSAGLLNAASAITVNGTLSFNRSDAITQGTHFSIAAIGGTGSIVQNGPGSLTLNAANTYSSGTTLNTGTLVIGNAAAAGTGTITQGSGSSLLKIDATGTIANNMSVYNVLASQSATLSGAITVNNAAWDVETGDTLTISGVVSGNGGVTKNGGGTLTLSGNNTFTGRTTINSGTLQASSANSLGSSMVIDVNSGSLLVTTANAVNDTAAINLNGGTLAVSGVFDETVGLLTLSANSVIDLDGFTGTLRFGGVGSWASGTKLAIWNWNGFNQYNTPVGDGANNRHVVFTNNNGLPNYLDRISFYSDNGTSFAGTAFEEGFSGSGTEIIAVPEPGSWATGLLLVLGGAVWLWRKKRHDLGSQMSQTQQELGSGSALPSEP